MLRLVSLYTTFPRPLPLCMHCGLGLCSDWFHYIPHVSQTPSSMHCGLGLCSDWFHYIPRFQTPSSVHALWVGFVLRLVSLYTMFPRPLPLCMHCGLGLCTLLLKKEHSNEYLSIFAIPRLNGCHLGQVSLQRDGDSTLTNQLPDVGCDPITTEGTSE